MEKRIIKFRAWNGKEMIFRELHDRNWYTEDKGGKDVKGTHPDDNYFLKVMQFTGLHDKNGKEIYEGDIVEYSLTHELTERLFISEVEFFRFAWRLKRLWLFTEVNKCTVIGNIYQNPELLNQTN